MVAAEKIGLLMLEDPRCSSRCTLVGKGTCFFDIVLSLLHCVTDVCPQFRRDVTSLESLPLQNL